MLQGKLAEMQTGEGKTLTAALPAATAALSGVPVHIITANDYLAARDADHLRPLYQALGLSIGVVTESMDFHARRAAYACDITYCTNKQIAFDYLRDRVERGSTHSKLNLELDHFYGQTTRGQRLMLRGLCFAIVDEADSVLIDEARTPLVLSRTLQNDISLEVDYHQALKLAASLTEGVEFKLLTRERQVQLTPRGSSRLVELSEQMGSHWKSNRQREELVLQALSAHHLFIRDRDYVVRDEKVQIIDVNTGRVMSDRSWELGLHQMIETKEDCKLTQPKETLARISYQRFFGRYLKLSGMTGTASEVRQEFSQVYGLSVVPVTPHRLSRRITMPERVYPTAEHAINAMAISAREQVAMGRPVLIGTRSVKKSEQLAQILLDTGVPVQLLNARQDAEEASIIAQAGKPGQITVATNMAGRGTDIKLAPGVAHKGGLHVIIVERNDAGRLDRQLYGRCARQGDPGSYQIFSSLEDDICEYFYGRRILNVLAWLEHSTHHTLPGPLGRGLIRLAQWAVEHKHRQSRRQVEYEDAHLSSILSFSGEPD